MFFDKRRHKRIDELVRGHLNVVLECRNRFLKFLDMYFEKGICDSTEELVKEIDILETSADRRRHEIINLLVRGALLPNTRGEILKLIEYVDNIANAAEELSKQIILQGVIFTDYVKEYIREMNGKEEKQINVLKDLIDSLFLNIHDIEKSLSLIKEIEVLETEVDKIEYKAIKKTYECADLSLAEKTQLKDMISSIADVADLIENISDLLEIVIATRRV